MPIKLHQINQLMILYYSTKFHFIIINIIVLELLAAGTFRPLLPPPLPQAEPLSKSLGRIGLIIQ